MWNYMSVGKKDYPTRFLTLLTLLILNGMVKTKLAIFPILCCEENVKNSNAHLKLLSSISGQVNSR